MMKKYATTQINAKINENMSEDYTSIHVVDLFSTPRGHICVCGMVAVRTWMTNEAIACWIVESTKKEERIIEVTYEPYNMDQEKKQKFGN